MYSQLRSDDKVEEGHLSKQFDITCRAWKTKFHLPYTYCGCPLPGDSVGQKFMRMISKYDDSAEPPSSLTPLTSASACNGTHPSDHNGVYPFHRTWVARKDRETRVSKFKKQQKQAQKEKGFTVENERYDRGMEHDMPFYYPIPLYYNNFSAGYGACAGYAANVTGVEAVSPALLSLRCCVF